MRTTNYTNTLIEMSADCPAESATVPNKPGTVAALQYELLSDNPYGFTSDELLAAVATIRQKRPISERPAVMAELLSKPQACLRSSPLVKNYGWCLHHDSKGKVALVAPDSDAYRQLHADPGVAKIRGLRARKD